MRLPDDKTRFECELDFVCMLSQTDFVRYLIDKYKDDDAFIEWMKYLQYWRKSPYIRYVINPLSLFYLEKLQDK